MNKGYQIKGRWQHAHHLVLSRGGSDENINRDGCSWHRPACFWTLYGGALSVPLTVVRRLGCLFSKDLWLA